MTDRIRMTKLLQLRTMRADQSRRMLNDAIRNETEMTLAAETAAKHHAEAERAATAYTSNRFAEADLSRNAAEFMRSLTYNIRSLRKQARTKSIEAGMHRRRQHNASQSRQEIADRYKDDQARQDQIARTAANLTRKFLNLREDAEEQSVQEIRKTRDNDGLC